MTFIRSFMLLVLMLGAAAITRANDYEIYGLTLCNSGELKFDVAVAAKVPGGWLSSDKWSVYGWIPIEPKECKEVYHDETWGEVNDIAVHVAVAFTDATGAWGPVKLDVKEKSSYQFCGTQEYFSYPHAPADYCIGSQFMIPASLDYNGNGLHTHRATNIGGIFVAGYKAEPLTVALSSKDRVSAVVNKGSGGASSSGNSASSSSSGASSGKSGWDTFFDVMKDVLDEVAREDRDRKRREQAAAAAEADRVPPTPPKASPPPEGPTEPPPESKPSTVPTIDPNYDPVGPGGFITPSSQVRVQVCVPGNLVDHQSWENPPVGGKMEAFRDATAKMIFDDARSIRDLDNTQFRILDVFDSFDPATPDAHQLVTVLHLVSGTHACPPNLKSYVYSY